MKNIDGIPTLLLALAASAAHAHPLGPSSIDRLSALEVRADMVVVRYTVDLAAGPAERERLDYQRDPKGYATTHADALADGLTLSVDGKPFSLTVRTADAAPTVDENGEAGLQVSAEYRAKVSFGLSARRLTFTDGNYPIHKGRRLATVAAGPGLTLPDAPKTPVERLAVTVAPTAAQTSSSVALAGAFLTTIGLCIVRRRR